MFAAALLSFGVVFLAELGDKSQLITMTYALRYRWWVVLSGVGIAAFLVHGISVTVGHFLGLTLPRQPIAFVAAIAFFAFAIWTFREGGTDEDETDASAAAKAPRFVILAVISSFVLAELGDKTMLATVALAADNSWAGVWAGATAGMVLADGVAIAVGRLLHRRLPERLLHVLAAVLFLLFGVWILFNSALGRPGLAIVVTSSVAVVALAVAVGRWLVRRRRTDSPPVPEPSSDAA
ncbi:MAG: TMEM165/GDT1 family protein [Mycobacterium sp.]|nr:TMEM165/GDT1 family protein [Mycobacterium sp.]